VSLRPTGSRQTALGCGYSLHAPKPDLTFRCATFYSKQSGRKSQWAPKRLPCGSSYVFFIRGLSCHSFQARSAPGNQCFLLPSTTFWQCPLVPSNQLTYSSSPQFKIPSKPLFLFLVQLCHRVLRPHLLVQPAACAWPSLLLPTPLPEHLRTAAHLPLFEVYSVKNCLFIPSHHLPKSFRVSLLTFSSPSQAPCQSP